MHTMRPGRGLATFRVEVADLREPCAQRSMDQLRSAGLTGLRSVRTSRLYFLDGLIDRADAERIAHGLLADPVTQTARVWSSSDNVEPPPTGIAIEIHPRPGVMDPTAESVLRELRAAGFPIEGVRTGRRHLLSGKLTQDDVARAARRTLANDCIDEIVPGTAGVRPPPQPPQRDASLRHVLLSGMDDEALLELSRVGHLFLSLPELRAVQAHFRALGREPTDLELETISQTWSEHCVHKTLRSEIVYRGTPLPGAEGAGEHVERRYENLLRDTIVRATRELIDARRGPECLSVFEDNAGVIAWDERYGLAFKVETHNHPSAIEPYGGAATGVGGCIRDVLGCGLGARPIANTDVFCVAGSDWPEEHLPAGVLHPRRVLLGVVGGVADYGNRMGIPTVNGAVHFDPRYLGNPLVFCGCVGLLPRDRIAKAARPGDRIVLLGGRTGRDGIHGATFSSGELTAGHAEAYSHAVQIGNAITEKRVMDAVLRARDDAGGCLYSAITDCGAGGLSSAVGEMGANVGAIVDLEHVPLKYAGLRYDELWISEAQERMVLAVPPGSLDRLLQIAVEEEAEATVIGTFGPEASADASETPAPRLVVRYHGQVVGNLDMTFLHHGLPRHARRAEWSPESPPASGPSARGPVPNGAAAPAHLLARLVRCLSNPNVASREWIIRRYDHEVQGASVVKPLMGPGTGPCDAAVLRPRPDSERGVALGCGLAPQWSEVDPYWMAVAAIDEALRNVVSVGGDPRRTALLDNFCWGRSDDPRQLGGLVRACQACYDAAIAFGTPFVSGKDSLNNEFALEPRDVPALAEHVRRQMERDGIPGADAVAQRIRATARLSIPGTLLISAMSVVPDVRRCVTADLKAPGAALYLVGGWSVLDLDLRRAAEVHHAVAAAMRTGQVRSCHDVSIGGWLATVAEMAIGGARGVELRLEPDCPPPFMELAGGYVIEAGDEARLHFQAADVALRTLGRTRGDDQFMLGDRALPLGGLRRAWTG
jgi:phosphoribosylformylglycinamidine synthase II